MQKISRMREDSALIHGSEAFGNNAIISERQYPGFGKVHFEKVLWPENILEVCSAGSFLFVVQLARFSPFFSFMEREEEFHGISALSSCGLF
jgi:hypothetical protein